MCFRIRHFNSISLNVEKATSHKYIIKWRKYKVISEMMRNCSDLKSKFIE